MWPNGREHDLWGAAHNVFGHMQMYVRGNEQWLDGNDTHS